eukprot:scaffold6124_cov122-Cylindrotheca_fusiformis.AAC.40
MFKTVDRHPELHNFEIVALLSSDAGAFTNPMQTAATRTQASAKKSFFMSEDESLDKVQLTSARKEVVFDEKSGRFFETGLEAAECIPEEEYCQIDEETGR